MFRLNYFSSFKLLNPWLTQSKQFNNGISAKNHIMLQSLPTKSLFTSAIRHEPRRINPKAGTTVKNFIRRWVISVKRIRFLVAKKGDYSIKVNEMLFNMMILLACWLNYENRSVIINRFLRLLNDMLLSNERDAWK